MHEEFRELRRKWAKFIDVHRALFAKTGLPLSLAEEYARFLHLLDHGYFEDGSDPYVWSRDSTEHQQTATKRFLHAYFSAGFPLTLICLGYPSGQWNAEFETEFRQSL